MTQKHQALITDANDDLWKLKLSWQTAEFSPDDGIGPMDSLHQAGDSLVAVIRSTDEGFEPIGSGVMIGPGLLLTATHVLEEIAATGSPPALAEPLLLRSQRQQRVRRVPRPAPESMPALPALTPF